MTCINLFDESFICKFSKIFIALRNIILIKSILTTKSGDFRSNKADYSMW